MDKVKKDTDYSLLEQERKWKSQITEISQQHREELQNVTFKLFTSLYSML